MAKVKITTVEEPYSGMHVDFVAPCDCSSVEGLLIGTDTYSVVNALGEVVTGDEGAWVAGAIVSVILDCDAKKAYIQNQATSGVDFNEIYPVGSIYMSVNSTSPAQLFSGTWERIQDRFLMAAGSTYGAGTTGGSATHLLKIENFPGEAVRAGDLTKVGDSNSWSNGIWGAHGDSSEAAFPIRQYPNDFVNSQPINHMPPYLSVYVWKRIA